MKKILIAIVALAMVLSFAGCSSAPKSSNNMAVTDSFFGYDQSYDAASTEEGLMDSDFGQLPNNDSAEVSENSSASGRKLIRSVSLDMETLEFESFISALQQKVAATGGYIESSDISGNSYNYSHNRYASFTCRIPSAKLDSFLADVGGMGNVTSSYEKQDDVTLNYVDTEARITSLQTEYDRLLELLAQAENVDTIISLEARLSDVRYQLESYKSQLRTYDNLVDYSTVTLSLSEVKRVTAPEEEGVRARIQSDFSDNLYSVGTGLVDFFVWFVANIPYFAVIAVIVLIIVLIIKACLKNSPSHQAKAAWKKAEKERRKAEKLAKKNAAKAAAAAPAAPEATHAPEAAPAPEATENSENK